MHRRRWWWPSGRLVPVKRFDELLRVLAKVKTDQPDLEAVLIGEGYERPALEALRTELGADDWVHLPGRVTDEELVSWYRQAWVVASTSQREGWGMTLTEAAACGTPAVATDIAGHRDAVVDGESGLLVDDLGQLSVALGRVLGDDVLRSRLSKGRADARPLVQLGRHGLAGVRGAGRGSDELNAPPASQEAAGRSIWKRSSSPRARATISVRSSEPLSEPMGAPGCTFTWAASACSYDADLDHRQQPASPLALRLRPELRLVPYAWWEVRVVA